MGLCDGLTEANCLELLQFLVLPDPFNLQAEFNSASQGLLSDLGTSVISLAQRGALDPEVFRIVRLLQMGAEPGDLFPGPGTIDIPPPAPVPVPVPVPVPIPVDDPSPEIADPVERIGADDIDRFEAARLVPTRTREGGIVGLLDDLLGGIGAIGGAVAGGIGDLVEATIDTLPGLLGNLGGQFGTGQPAPIGNVPNAGQLTAAQLAVLLGTVGPAAGPGAAGTTAGLPLLLGTGAIAGGGQALLSALSPTARNLLLSLVGGAGGSAIGESIFGDDGPAPGGSCPQLSVQRGTNMGVVTRFPYRKPNGNWTWYENVGQPTEFSRYGSIARKYNHKGRSGSRRRRPR